MNYSANVLIGQQSGAIVTKNTRIPELENILLFRNSTEILVFREKKKKRLLSNQRTATGVELLLEVTIIT